MGPTYSQMIEAAPTACQSHNRRIKAGRRQALQRRRAANRLEGERLRVLAMAKRAAPGTIGAALR